jgi:hypothetical protein
VASNVGNIIPPSVNGGTPGGSTPSSSPGDAGAVPGAVSNAYKSDLANAFNFATDRATAAGKLGGYTDQWLNSNLASNAASRKIGVGNANANSLKSLLGPEQDLASIEAYKSPSAMGQLFSGLGGMLGSYSGTHASPNGTQLPFGTGSLFAPTPSSMLGPYTGCD